MRTRVFISIIGAAATCVSAGVAAEPRLDQPDVKDVVSAFAAIAPVGHRIGAWGGDALRYPFYSLNADHDIGDNHFQGVQRLRGGPYLVVSGSNIGSHGDPVRLGLPKPSGWGQLPPPQGDLFVLRIGEHATTGPLGPNISGDGRPPAWAKVVARVPIRLPLRSGTVLWHPGGLSACGDILVVPVENYNARHGDVCSQILFFDFSAPENPRRLPIFIDRTEVPVKDKAGAASMIRLPERRFLVASRTSTQTSFYLSRTADLRDGFEPTPASILDEKQVEAVEGLPFAKFSGSSINFIRQSDGQLFLVGFGRTKADPVKAEPERQTASLWRVEFPGGDFRALPRLTRVADHSFTGDLLGDAGWGIFGAAAGMYVSDAGALAIYATPRWQVRRVGEFTLEDLRAGRSVSATDQLFIPAIELWPR